MISFSKANIGKNEISSVVKVLKSGWLTMGEVTREFEKEFADYIGAKYVISVNSCTSGLFLSLKALDIGPGDEVILPSLTFAATANVIEHVGAKPVFADIKENDFTLDEKSVEKYITKNTKAIIPVHFAGRLAYIKYSLPVIEDSAHLISFKKSSSNLTSYSFYATKNMTTGEGGMISTNNKKLASWLLKARLHGMSKDAWKRYGNKGKWKYDVEFPGYKVNTTDLNSALGRIQLKRLPEIQKRRNEIVEEYNKHLGLKNSGNHLYTILVEKRDIFMDYMTRNGVQCSVHFLPVHMMTAYKKYKAKLPVTEYVGKRIVSLPLYPTLRKVEIEHISDLVKKYRLKYG